MKRKNKAINRFIDVLCATTAVYYIYIYISGTVTSLLQIAPILMVGLIATFLIFPMSKHIPSKIGLAIDCLLAALSTLILWKIISSWPP